MRKLYWPMLIFIFAYLLIAFDTHAETCSKSSNFKDIMKINQKLNQKPKIKQIELKKL